MQFKAIHHRRLKQEEEYSATLNKSLCLLLKARLRVINSLQHTVNARVRHNHDSNCASLHTLVTHGITSRGLCSPARWPASAAMRPAAGVSHLARQWSRNDEQARPPCLEGDAWTPLPFLSPMLGTSKENPNESSVQQNRFLLILNCL